MQRKEITLKFVINGVSCFLQIKDSLVLYDRLIKQEVDVSFH